MARKQHSINFHKAIATLIGAAAIVAGVWINVRLSAGLGPEMTVAAVVVTLAAALAPIFFERALKGRQWAKALGLAGCFVLGLAFNLTNIVGKTGAAKDAEIADAKAATRSAQVAQEAYDAAKAAAAAECVKRGPRCRAAEQAVQEAAKALQAAPAERPADSGADRIVAAIPALSAEQVRIWQPMLLPIGLELIGFCFLAFGLAPGARQAETPAAPAKKKAKAKPKGRAKARAKPTPEIVLGGNVVPFRVAANDN